MSDLFHANRFRFLGIGNVNRTERVPVQSFPGKLIIRPTDSLQEAYQALWFEDFELQWRNKGAIVDRLAW
jgi:hypothetical protein